MWFDVQNQESLLNDDLLENKVVENTNKRIVILEAPSGCGKTRFIKSIKRKRTLRIPSNIFLETIFFSDEYKFYEKNLEMILYFITNLYGIDIVCLEDIDYVISRGEATQELYARIVLSLSKKYLVIVTVINISNDCKVFLSCIHDQYRHFKFFDQKKTER